MAILARRMGKSIALNEHHCPTPYNVGGDSPLGLKIFNPYRLVETSAECKILESPPEADFQH